MANVDVFVNKDHRVILQGVANQVSIGKASAYQLSHENIGMSKVSARWVPKKLPADQKKSRVTIAKEHLRCFNHDENKVLNCIVTGDELRIHCAEPETKAQSK